jgi:isopenicillin N synthase-like dioxygenase
VPQTLTVPIIDISGFRAGTDDDRRAIAREVADACTDIGFLVVSGHGVPEEVVDGLYRASRTFFELPLEQKMAVARPRPDQIRGYSGVESESLGNLEGEAAPPDLKELFDIGPLDVDPDDPYAHAEAAGQHFAPNVWPSDLPGFEDAFRTYYGVMQALTLDLFEIIATALDLPADHFVDKVDRHISILRANYYPRQVVPPKPDQIRGGAHSDYTAFTILWQEDVPGGGLQIRTRAGEWIDLPAVPGSFVVNLGDSMMRWTNDTWVSTMHRVVNPPPEIARDHARISFAHFVQPNYDAVIECIDSCQGPDRPAKYPPVRNGDFLLEKFTQQNTLEDS